MSIRIKSLNVRNLGPIPELRLDFANFNLIYGHNEKGKSYLVEFLIRSLFKAEGWDLREELGIGKVIVEGITGREIEFSPDSKDKIEDYLTEKYIGLPPDFSKLLVLKSTEVELGNEKESDKVMLRRFLSHKEILDKIKDEIQITVAESKVDGYRIDGKKTGKIKDRMELESELERLEEIFTNVEGNYLGGDRKELEMKKEGLESKFRKLEKAKCYLAYAIDKDIEMLKETANQINENKIDEVLEKVNKLESKEEENEIGSKRFDDLKKTTQHFEWLEHAIEEYEKYELEEIVEKPSKWLGIGFIGLFILTCIFIGLNLPIFSFSSLVGLFFIGYLYKRKYDKYLKDTGKREESKRLKEGYLKRFNEELKELPTMVTKRDNMKEDYSEMKGLQKHLKEQKSNIRSLEQVLNRKVADLFGKELERDEWKEELKRRKQDKRELEKKIHFKENRLTELNVKPPEYMEEKPDIEFNKEEYKRIEESLKEVKDNIETKNNELEGLKRSVYEHIKDMKTTDWNVLIQNLAKKREKTLCKYKEITAEIIGEKYVCDVIDKLYKEEDEKIKDALESEIVSDMLPQVTTHYEKISLMGDRMIVSDTYNDFPVESISDGAKEQVFLALRIGLAKHWFKKDELFLIFDDAFLHSDYNRRPKLIDKVIELAKSGWQIICFTFDDNIKKLFDEKAKKFGDDYRFFDLNEI
ncbi:hypothetical protein KAX29_06105 [candidate division WOR-3 bacterium]|nr:hypothetical protein [candidate division WOR-3 bacterium]